MGEKSGHSRKALFGNHTNHYDAEGRKIGESRPSLFGDHTNVYDASGNKVGEARKGLFGDHTNHYDAGGNKIGETRHPLFGNHLNHFDAGGNKVGESREALFSDATNHYGSWTPGAGTRRSGGAPTGGYGSSGAGSGYSGGYNYGYGYGGSGSYPRPRSRLGLIFEQVIVYLIGMVGAIGCIVALVVALHLFGTSGRGGNLERALTTDKMFGFLLAAGWVMLWPIVIVVSQVFFTADGQRDFEFGKIGGIVGAGALLLLGLLGLADEWGGVLPAIGITLGYIAGTIVDWRKDQ
ncbi:MAG: hypothetical protein KF883_12915 [Thermomicrobiales bacterium]|nr:hypothetical protein [Thermomicrobiales bacterium]